MIENYSLSGIFGESSCCVCYKPIGINWWDTQVMPRAFKWTPHNTVHNTNGLIASHAWDTRTRIRLQLARVYTQIASPIDLKINENMQDRERVLTPLHGEYATSAWDCAGKNVHHLQQSSVEVPYKSGMHNIGSPRSKHWCTYLGKLEHKLSVCVCVCVCVYGKQCPLVWIPHTQLCVCLHVPIWLRVDDA